MLAVVIVLSGCVGVAVGVWLAELSFGSRVREKAESGRRLACGGRLYEVREYRAPEERGA